MPKTDIQLLPPPKAPRHEMALLGCCLVDGGQPEVRLTVLCSVSDTDFADRRCRAAIRAVRKLVAEGEAVNLLTVRAGMERAGTADLDSTFLDELTFDLPDPWAVGRYVQEVRDARMCRELLHGAQKVALRAASGDTEALAEAKAMVEAAQELAEVRGFEAVGPLAEALCDELDAMPIGGVVGIPSGIPQLDHLMRGFRPGQFILIAGRPGMGKSALALGIAGYVGLDVGKPVGYITLEMAAKENVRRLAAMRTGIAHDRIRANDLNLVQRHALRQWAQQIAAAPLYFEDAPQQTVDEMERRIWTLQREHGCAMVVIDYLQLVDVEGGADSREQEVARLSRSCKQMARTLGVPVIALAQLSRKCEERQDKRPVLHDLRESGSLEQDADAVLLVYRDRYYHKDADPLAAEISVAKQRDGATDIVQCHFDEATMQFSQ